MTVDKLLTDLKHYDTAEELQEGPILATHFWHELLKGNWEAKTMAMPYRNYLKTGLILCACVLACVSDHTDIIAEINLVH